MTENINSKAIQKNITLPHLQVAYEVLEVIEAEARRYEQAQQETGGILVGKRVKESARAGEGLLIVAATGPGPNALHHNIEFNLDTQFANAELGRLRAAQPDTDFVGIWHKHPPSLLCPSSGDLASARQMLHDPDYLQNGLHQLINPIVVLRDGKFIINFYYLDLSCPDFIRLPFTLIDQRRINSSELSPKQLVALKGARGITRQTSFKGSAPPSNATKVTKPTLPVARAKERDQKTKANPNANTNANTNANPNANANANTNAKPRSGKGAKLVGALGIGVLMLLLGLGAILIFYSLSSPTIVPTQPVSPGSVEELQLTVSAVQTESARKQASLAAANASVAARLTALAQPWPTPAPTPLPKPNSGEVPSTPGLNRPTTTSQ